MTLEQWLPPIATTSLLAGVVWLSKNLILTRLTRSVSSEFDSKLEGLRFQLRESEERLKAELRVKESEIEALRSGAISALATRQAAVDKRRLEAVDQIWISVSTFEPARRISEMLSRFKYEAMSTEAEKNSKIREALGVMDLGLDFKALDFSSANKARPFVTPMVWANYSALSAVYSHAIARWHLLKSGLGNKDLVDDQAVVDLLRIALPHQSEYVETYRSSGFYFLIDELERKLLIEMEAMLTKPTSDLATVEQAANILAASNAVIVGLNKPAKDA